MAKSSSHPAFGGWAQSPVQALKAQSGISLAEVDPAATPGWDAGRKAGEAWVRKQAPQLSELQEKLFAHGRTGGTKSVLLVLQGMDTSGKGGIVRHVVGLVDPQGVAHRSFGKPTAEELTHHYLWRVRGALPAAGMIGVFDRSHYEDVLIARVDSLVPEDVWRARYAEINAFEEEILAAETVVVKVLLALSPEEQKARLMSRLDRPEKYWKFDPSDIAARAQWSAYAEAYQDVLDETNTASAPWYVVPADHKWYARLAVSALLLDVLRTMDLTWPNATYDVAEQRRLLDEL